MTKIEIVSICPLQPYQKFWGALNFHFIFRNDPNGQKEDRFRLDIFWVNFARKLFCRSFFFVSTQVLPLFQKSRTRNLLQKKMIWFISKFEQNVSFYVRSKIWFWIHIDVLAFLLLFVDNKQQTRLKITFKSFVMIIFSVKLSTTIQHFTKSNITMNCTRIKVLEKMFRQLFTTEFFFGVDL